MLWGKMMSIALLNMGLSQILFVFLKKYPHNIYEEQKTGLCLYRIVPKTPKTNVYLNVLLKRMSIISQPKAIVNSSRGHTTNWDNISNLLTPVQAISNQGKDNCT